MKTFLIIISICLFAEINAQEWKPVNSGRKYNYRADTANYITNVVFIDSVNIINGDSVFYLNRIMTRCDTCSNNENDDFALKNQPQFFMRKMIKKSDSLFIFSDTLDLVVKPLSKTGATWLFDSKHATLATVTMETEQPVFGITDSIKNISLSNGKTMIISKNFGILEFPAADNIKYILAGTEGASYSGEKLPGFHDFLNWEVGDIFQRENFLITADQEEDIDIKKYKIISKTVSGDTLRYAIEGWVKHIHHGYPAWDTTAIKFTNTLQYIDSARHFTNRYPCELINIQELVTHQFSTNQMFNRIELRKENGRYVKKIGSDHKYPQYPLFPYYNLSANPDFLIKYNGCPLLFELKYFEGLGYNYRFSFFEGGMHDIFIGKIHAGDTIGTVDPDSLFIIYSDIHKVNGNRIIVFPNPVCHEQILQIHSDIIISNYSIYNVSGQRILSGKYQTQGIDIKTLLPGFYMLEMDSEKGVIRKKIMVR